MKKQPFKMQWVINKFRADKRTGAINPIKYAKYLMDKGAGFNE